MTWYDVLEVSQTATTEEIKRAYRRLVLRRHPDAGGSNRAMRELLKAYRILSDPIQRQVYDQTLGYADSASEGQTSYKEEFYENGPDPTTIPAFILQSAVPLIHSRQQIWRHSNGQTITFPRCIIGIHSVMFIPAYASVVVLMLIRNLMAQIQPIWANETYLLDHLGLQSPGDNWIDELWDNPVQKLWPTHNAVRPYAMTRFSMFYPWEGFGQPARWAAQWAYFAAGSTSGRVLGYLDLDIPLKDVTEAV